MLDFYSTQPDLKRGIILTLQRIAKNSDDSVQNFLNHSEVIYSALAAYQISQNFSWGGDFDLEIKLLLAAITSKNLSHFARSKMAANALKLIDLAEQVYQSTSLDF